MEHSRTAYVVLGILAIHDNQSGYEIRKTIEQSVGFFWGESYGQLYPTLKQLLAEKLIAGDSDTGKSSAGKRTRRSYSITPAGRECLKGWLALPFRDDPPRDEFLLKLFFGEQAAPGISVGHIQAFQQKSRRLLDTMLELERLATAHNSRPAGFPYWMLTLSYGVGQLRAALAWSESALATLEANPLPNSKSVPETKTPAETDKSSNRQKEASNVK